MVRVDAAPRAEVVLRRAGIEPVNSQRLFAGVVECAPEGGQFQAAVLTGCWAWRSSYCAGLR